MRNRIGHRCRPWLAGAAASMALIAAPARADEGMWTFDAFATATMQASYGWAPDAAWLDRVRNAAVRLTSGCSASFVSAEGLILTNAHCVADCAQSLGSGTHNPMLSGFIARDRADERRCPGQQAEVVTAITDVTAAVKAALAGQSDAALVAARNARIAEIERNACADRVRTRCQVVTLFGGGRYSLYTYRIYDDVRLVWTPEFQAAMFGGDPDNFNFPRYALDGAFLRAWEDGKPAHTPAHLTWAPRAPVPGEATFVVGNPASTQRLLTLDQIAHLRDVRLPLVTVVLAELRGRLIATMATNPDKAREGANLLFSVENMFKLYDGQLAALHDPIVAHRLAANEAALKARTAGNAGNAGLGDPWAQIAAAVAAYRDLYPANARLLPSGTLATWAAQLVKAARERARPEGERLPGYTDSALPLLRKTVLDSRPVYPWLEQLLIEWTLAKARERLGADDPDTRLMLGRESPEGLAARLVHDTKLADPAVRQALWDGGLTAIEASDDPLIAFARRLEPRQRELQQQINARYLGPIAAASATLAEARFAAWGASVYPDATFSLRISYGQVAGWTERGRPIAPITTLGGTFARATAAPPFDLPTAYRANADRLARDTPLDFVTTNDVVGGNSGSPVIDRNGAVIGAEFDGNIHALGGEFAYQSDLNRTVVVSTAALEHALEVIYPAPGLVRELAGK